MTLINIQFESKDQLEIFVEHGGLNALGLHMQEARKSETQLEYRGELSTRLWDGCRDYVEECGGEWTAVTTLPRDDDDA